MAENGTGIQSLWSRLQAHPAFRAGAVYAGASWLALQASDVLVASTQATRALAVILAVGFIGVVGGAWLLAVTRRRREEGGVAPRRRPGRQWLIVALGFVAIGTLLWLFAPRLLAGDVEAGADRIAVLPFRANTQSAREIADGMVDLLSAGLDEAGAIRTVHPRTVMHRWDAAGAVDDRAELEIGRAVGAGSVLSGSVFLAGDELRIEAVLRATEDGAELAEATARGSRDEVLRVVDALTVELLREVWRSREPVPQLRLRAILTSSPEALRSYLRGEQLYRALAWDSATTWFRDAIAADSTFALAAVRLSETLGWSRGHGDPEALGFARQAVRHADRLPERERSLIAATLLHEEGRPQALDSLEAYTARYPDDPLGWYHLGDARVHSEAFRAWTEAELFGPFDQVRRLDPSFTPAPFHPFELALRSHDRARAASYLSWTRESPLQALEGLTEAAFEVAFGPVDSVAGAVASMGRFASAAVTGSLLHSAADGRLTLDPNVDPAWAVNALRAFDDSVQHPITEWGVRAFSAEAMMAAGRPLAALDSIHAAAEDAPFPLPPPIFRELTAAAGGLLPREHVQRLAEEGMASGDPQQAIVAAMAGLVLGETGAVAAVEQSEMPAGMPDTAMMVALRDGYAAAVDAWATLLEGDTAAALDRFQRVAEETWYQPSFYGVMIPLFQYAKVLSLDPARREEGLRRLRLYLREPAMRYAAWLAIAEAQESAGDRAAAAEAYGHILRLMQDPEPHLVPHVEAARRALERLTREGGLANDP